MAKRLTQALGVDIGTQMIKIAAVRQTKDGPAVVGLGMTATPEGTVDHTGIFDPQTLGTALKGLIAETGVGIKDVVFCINGQSAVVVRNLEVPRMGERELQEHMNWEIQRNVPFAESTLVSDFRTIDNPNLANSQNMEVVMAVSPQSAIDMILTLIKTAGCKAAAIDVEPLALARVINTCSPTDFGAKNICLVHFGHTCTAINMYRSSALAFPRTIPLGSSQLTKAIADGLAVSMEQAEQMKQSANIPEAGSSAYQAPQQTQSFTPYNPFAVESGEEGGDTGPEQTPPAESQPTAAMEVSDNRAFQAMENQLMDLVAELRRSVDYYKSRGGDVEQMVLSGGGAMLKGLDQYISRSMGMPVGMIKPLDRIAVQLDSQSETYAQERASQFSVAIGMGLYIAYD